MAKQNYKFLNGTALAYIGDSVYELFVRKRLLDRGEVHSDMLHKQAINYVSADGQSKALKSMLEELTDEELAVVKRARNRKIISKPKNATPMTYKWATALEALVGYLYLTEQDERLNEILEMATENLEKEF